MAYLPALKQHKKFYIVLIAIISVVIITNESMQFLEEIQNLSLIGYLLILLLLTGLINAGIRLRISEN